MQTDHAFGWTHSTSSLWQICKRTKTRFIRSRSETKDELL